MQKGICRKAHKQILIIDKKGNMKDRYLKKERKQKTKNGHSSKRVVFKQTNKQTNKSAGLHMPPPPFSFLQMDFPSYSDSAIRLLVYRHFSEVIKADSAS